MGYVEDSDTMRQCSLAGSCLHPCAQRALFTEVRIIIGTEGSSNLDKLLECYTTRPYARYARYLSTEYRGQHMHASHYLGDHPDLQTIVTLLSTCQQVIDPANTSLPLPASRISFLNVFGVAGSILEFARILRAFPKVIKLRCDPDYIWREPQDELDLFLASAPSPPRLQHLQVLG